MPGFRGHFEDGEFRVDEQWDDSPEELAELLQHIREILQKQKEV